MDGTTAGIVAGVVLLTWYAMFWWLVGAVPERAKEMVAGGAVLLDVRPARDFSRSHIAGSINIPLSQLAARMGELGDRSRPVVVTCAHGLRAMVARWRLRRAGFKTVFNLGPSVIWGAQHA